MVTVFHINDSRAFSRVAIGARDTESKQMETTYLNLAAYNYRMAKRHADRGDVDRANACLKNARAYDAFAMESN